MLTGASAGERLKHRNEGSTVYVSGQRNENVEEGDVRIIGTRLVLPDWDERKCSSERASRLARQHVPIPPKALSKEEIQEVVAKWKAAAKRAVDAGVDAIEIHAAHGFLLHEFLSPVSNKRTDEYGGSFENRARIVIEVVDAIREVIPETMPLFLRPSATDWLEKVAPEEPSWRLEDTVRLAGLVAEHGVDLIDVSSGGLDPRQKIEIVAPAYQAHFAEAVKKAHGERVLVGAVGGIKTGTHAQEILDKGQADVILVATQFLKDPAAARTFAEDLGIEVKSPHQSDWVFHGRGSALRWK
ncbi:hypothetical protein C8Q73DRAFT_767614 [Cubamyces lactineus]|nr:hypothetical protein C8Q73DRAFT_767614 [Cubamyces lactineus]